MYMTDKPTLITTVLRYCLHCIYCTVLAINEINQFFNRFFPYKVSIQSLFYTRGWDLDSAKPQLFWPGLLKLGFPRRRESNIQIKIEHRFLRIYETTVNNKLLKSFLFRTYAIKENKNCVSILQKENQNEFIVSLKKKNTLL